MRLKELVFIRAAVDGQFRLQGFAYLRPKAEFSSMFQPAEGMLTWARRPITRTLTFRHFDLSPTMVSEARAGQSRAEQGRTGKSRAGQSWS